MIARLSIATAMLALYSATAAAATYFVDPPNGNDANSGSTKSAPWKSVPGMDGVDHWGVFNAGNKIPAGTTIEIKAGAFFLGKRWVIDKTFFQSGTATSPVIIQVSASWGVGNVVIDGRGAIVPKWLGGVQITELSYITITGAAAARRFEIKNFLAHSNILHYNGSNNHSAVGNSLKWFDCHHSASYCVNNSWQDDLLYEDGIAHDNGALEGGTRTQGTGIIMGDANDTTGKNNIIRRVISYGNGSNSKKIIDNVSFGFQITGGENTLFDSCEAYGNGRDGFDGGRADNAGNASMTFINSLSHDNFEDGFGLNAGPAGNVTAIHINSIASRNGQANWTVYDGARVEIYHAAGRATGFNILAFMSFPNWPAPTVKIRNSYMSAAKGGRQIQYYNQDRAGYPVFDSDHNLWVPHNSDSEMFDNDKQGNYSMPPNWKGAHDKLGIEYSLPFLNLVGDSLLLPKTMPTSKITGIFLTSPLSVRIDRNGIERSDPPSIGPFEASGAKLNK